MSLPQPPQPAKLVVGLFLRKQSLLRAVSEELSSAFGPIDMVSPWLPFNYTSYYETEMGTPLFRRVFAYKHLILQRDLPEVKITTNAVERQYSAGGKRQVNIDPGYLLRERFVLASGKNFCHRIYLDQGIYADLTLVYQKNAYQKLPWTYPDYADSPVVRFLEHVRNKYVIDLKHKTVDIND